MSHAVHPKNLRNFSIADSSDKLQVGLVPSGRRNSMARLPYVVGSAEFG